MTMGEQISSFAKQFIAYVKGKEDAVAAEKVKRKAIIALDERIKKLDYKIIVVSNDLQEADERLDEARINRGETDLNRDLYLSNLVSCRNEVIKLELSLEDHQNLRAFLKEQRELVAKK